MKWWENVVVSSLLKSDVLQVVLNLINFVRTAKSADVILERTVREHVD